MEKNRLTRHYDVVAKLRKNQGDPSSEELRASALPGQGISHHQNIGFTRPQGAHEGDFLKIAVITETDRKGTPYLRAAARKDQSITIISLDEAREILGSKGLSPQRITSALA